MQVFSSQTGIAFTNYVNSSLNVKLDLSDCPKGLFNYNPICRFFYMNALNQTSVFMNPPQISVSAIPPYLSQYVCQRGMFYNQVTQSIEINHVQCILLRLSNMYNYFQNIIQSSKQYYVIDPRTHQIFFNSKIKNNYSNMSEADNFQNIELQYLEDQDQASQIRKYIVENYNTWVFQQEKDGYANILQMIELSKKVFIMDYKRNGTTYKAILNPVILYDQIPKIIKKYTQQQGLLLEYAYLQINIISDEDLKAQTIKLLNFFSTLFIIVQVTLIGLSLIILFITVIYSIQIQTQIDKPIIRMTQTLEQINQLKELVDICEIIKKYEEKAQFIFLSKETYQLYQSFQDLFEMIMYTSESFFTENEDKNLISLSKKVDFFTKFKNYNAAGITHNNIGCILLNQQHYFEALEHFSLSIMYAKYEISAYVNNNPDSIYLNMLLQYSFSEDNNQRIDSLSKSYNNSINQKNLTPSTKSQFNKSSQNLDEKKQKSEKIIGQFYQKETLQNQFFQNKNQYGQQMKQFEDRMQVQELLLNLMFRQQNYIITLITFQENYDSSLQKTKQPQKGFYFWNEIKKLVKQQVKLLNNNQDFSYLKIFMNCLISKCYYNQYQNFKAKQKFTEAQTILKNFKIPRCSKTQENISQNFKSRQNLKENNQDETQRNLGRSSFFADFNQQSPTRSNKFMISQLKNQLSKQSSNKNFNLDQTDQVYVTQNNHNNEFNDLQNSFEISQRIFLSQKQDLVNQCFLQSFLNNKNKNQKIQQSDFQLLNNQLQNLYSKVFEIKFQNDKINLKTLQQMLHQLFLYSLSEYFIFTKKYKKAAEILTSLFEGSQNMASNLPFRIFFKLKEIFDVFKIKDSILNEEYSRFNKNLQFQIAVCFDLNIKQNSCLVNSSLVNQNNLEDYNQFNKIKYLSNNQRQFLQELSQLVLNKKDDKICLFSFDQEEKCIIQNVQLINSNLYRQFQDNIFDKINIPQSNTYKYQNYDYKFDKSLNSEIVSLKNLQMNISQHFRDIKNEQEERKNKNRQQINKTLKKFFISDLNQAQTLQNYTNIKPQNNEKQANNQDNSFYLQNILVQQQNNQNQKDKSQHKEEIKYNQKQSLNKQFAHFNNQVYKYFQKHFFHKRKNEIQFEKYFFYDFVRKALDQLVQKQFTFKISKTNLNQINKKLNQNFEAQKQYISKKLGGQEYSKSLKFIIYQAKSLSFLEDKLFKHLKKILFKFNIQILIFQTQNAEQYFEGEQIQQSQSYMHKNKEIVKIFSSYEEMIQYLIFQRDSFSNFTYYSYIQYY